jgi:predicted lysophospholipase L1 biosynthesis ABC-type transport system permease subunit
MSNAPVENKVKVATAAGAGSAGIITPFVVWLLDQLFFDGGAQPDVPLPLVGMIGLVITGLCTFAGGWYAKHTVRRSDGPGTSPAQPDDATAAAGPA